MRKIIIFGAGEFGRRALSFYGEENVEFFADNNSLRIGKKYFGKEIISVGQLKKLSHSYEVIIAVKNFKPVRRQLLENGILEFQVFTDSVKDRCGNDRKVILYGIGELTEKAVEYYGKDNIAFVVDTENPGKAEYVKGIPIIDETSYFRIGNRYRTVITAQDYKQAQLKCQMMKVNAYGVFGGFTGNGISTGDEAAGNGKPPAGYAERLYTPTQITKTGAFYFIVDCWHHRIICSDRLEKEIGQWTVLDERLSGPHSIATDGNMLLVDNTDEGEVWVYAPNNGKYSRSQIIYGLGSRPHKIVYSSEMERFFVLLSETMEIAVLRPDKTQISLERIVPFEENPAYTRGMHLIDGKLFIVSGNGRIMELCYRDLSFSRLHDYEVPDEFYGMNDIIKAGDYYYLSVYHDREFHIKPRLIRTRDLHMLQSGEYEDIYEKCSLKGVPYFFSYFDRRLFFTEIDLYSGIVSFELREGKLINKKEHFAFPEISDASLIRRYEKEQEHLIQKAKIENRVIRHIREGSCKGRSFYGNNPVIDEQVRFHMDRQRENLISWYPFTKEDSILEVNAGLGALSGRLCESCREVVSYVETERQKEAVNTRCRKYGNHSVIAGDVFTVPVGQRFDYILLACDTGRQHDTYLQKELLSEISALLKPGGRLLIAADNRIGCRHFRKEERVKGAITASELKGVLSGAGFDSTYFYYPMPDWRYPQVVCSEQYRVPFPVEPGENAYGKNEKDLYSEMVDNDATEQLNQSFLVECGRGNLPPHRVIYSVFGRGKPDKGLMNTSIWDSGELVKTPVSIADIAQIRKIYDNTQRLKLRGIKIIDGYITDDRYVTHSAKYPTLEQVIRDYAKRRQPEKIMACLEKLKKYMKNASETFVLDDEIMLRTGYMDMVCRKVFVDGEEYIFYTQEWTEENIPLNYVLYRVILLLYNDVEELSHLMAYESILFYFGLQSRLTQYEKMEREFQMNGEGDMK